MTIHTIASVLHEHFARCGKFRTVTLESRDIARSQLAALQIVIDSISQIEHGQAVQVFDACIGLKFTMGAGSLPEEIILLAQFIVQQTYTLTLPEGVTIAPYSRTSFNFSDNSATISLDFRWMGMMN